MCRNRNIMIRVSERELKIITNRKSGAGYANLSDYVRRILLGQELTLLQMVEEMHKEVCNGNKNNS